MLSRLDWKAVIIAVVIIGVVAYPFINRKIKANKCFPQAVGLFQEKVLFDSWQYDGLISFIPDSGKVNIEREEIGASLPDYIESYIASIDFYIGASPIRYRAFGSVSINHCTVTLERIGPEPRL